MLARNARSPKALLFEAVVEVARAELPNAVLLEPVVLEDRARRPKALLASPVVFACNSGVAYFLNSKVMELDIHSGTDFIMRDWVPSINQDAKTALFMVGLELVIKNRRKLGKLNSVTA